MKSSAAELPLFAGETSPPERGILAKVRYEHHEEHSFPSEDDAFRRAGAPAYRVVPLLRLIGDRGSRKLVVGRARIAVHPGAKPEVTLLVTMLWAESGRWTQVENVLEQLDGSLGASLAEPPHPVHGDEQAIAATLAKAIAESSHNEVTRVRALRYELERRLSDQLSNRRRELMRPLLAEIIELSIAFNRARDQARAAARDGLWLWLCDDAAYQHGRTAGPPDAGTPIPERMHYHAIRHCESMATCWRRRPLACTRCRTSCPRSRWRRKPKRSRTSTCSPRRRPRAWASRP